MPRQKRRKQVSIAISVIRHDNSIQSQVIFLFPSFFLSVFRYGEPPLSRHLARQAASSSYFPIIVAINGGYIFLRLVYQRSLISVSHLLATLVLVILSFVSYKGILEDHANKILMGRGGAVGEALAGGASLDLLGLVSLVQYGSVFLSTKMYWSLVLIPIWGGWKLYAIFFGAKGTLFGGLFPNSTIPTTDQSSAENDDNAENSNSKKQKRADKRRKKWTWIFICWWVNNFIMCNFMNTMDNDNTLHFSNESISIPIS